VKFLTWLKKGKVKAGNIKMMFFIGVGGIGMSALARYFNRKGIGISGYDLTRTQLTDRLEKEGIDIIYSDDTGLLPSGFLEGDAAARTLVVYTPAIPSTNNILQYFITRGFEVIKRSKLLGRIVSKGRGIAVAGTHGKTSVSALTAHLLHHSPAGCTAFLGGVARNYNSNLLVNEESDLIVVEADEFDRSFLQLFPFIAVITSMDADHLDVYGSYDKMKEAFSSFAGQVREGGTIIVRKGIEPGIKRNTGVKRLSYGIDEEADYYACNIKITESGLPVFDLVGPGIIYTGLELGIPGRFNIENAVAAIAVSIISGTGEQEIRSGLKSFRGISRRFELIINTPGCVLIDDYAHHPAELKACISAVREIFPGRKITGVFQPHLYSRTRDFSEEFATSLEALDSLILLDIYPAREAPLPGVSSELIFEKVQLENKIACNRQELPGIIAGIPTDVVVTLGAGNIDSMVLPVRDILLKKANLNL
jgi:UDP-N-acetylmuramate--alanine ligase